MEYSRTFSVVPGNFRKKRKKFLTNPIFFQYLVNPHDSFLKTIPRLKIYKMVCLLLM